MEPIQTMIKFVENGSSNVQNTASTGDTISLCIIIAAVICATVAVGLACLFRARLQPVGKHGALLTQNVCTKVIAALLALMTVVLLVVGLTTNALSAKASQSNLALASETIEAKVDSNTGAITFEDGWIKSVSQEAVYFEGMLANYTDEVQVTENCNWQIAIDDKTVYEGNPGKDIDGAKSIEFNDSKLSIGVSNMSIETTKQLIGKNVLQLSFYVFDKKQDETAKEIEKDTEDFINKISDTSQFPQTAFLTEDKDELIKQINALKLEFEAKISTTTDPAELESIKSEFSDKVNNLIEQANSVMQDTINLKNKFNTSAKTEISEKAQLVKASPWLTNQQKEELQTRLENTESTTLKTVENSTSRENMNNAMKKVEDEIAEVQNSIEKAEEEIKAEAISEANNTKVSYEKAIEDDKDSFFSNDVALLQEKIKVPYEALVAAIKNAISPDVISAAQKKFEAELDALNEEVKQYKTETQNLRNHVELTSAQTQSNNEITVLKKDGKISDDTLNQNIQAIKSIVDAQIQYIAQATNLEDAKEKNNSAIDAINNIVTKIKAQVSEWNVKWEPETPIEIDVGGSYTFSSKPELDDVRAKQQKPDGPIYSLVTDDPVGMSIDWASETDSTPVISLDDSVAPSTYKIKIYVKYAGIVDSGCETIKEYAVSATVSKKAVIKTGNLHVKEKTPDGIAVEYTYAPVLKSGQTFSSMGVSFYSSPECDEGSKFEADTMAQLYGLEEENGTKYIGEPGLDLYYKIEPTENGLGGQLDDGKLYAIRAGITHTWEEIYNAQTGQKGDNITSYELKDKLSSEKWIGLDWTDVSAGSTADIKVGNTTIGTIGDYTWTTSDLNVASSYGINSSQKGIFKSKFFWSSKNAKGGFCWGFFGGSHCRFDEEDPSSEFEIVFSRAFVGSGTISGTVVDKKGKAISGASVKFGEQGTPVTTGADGKFSIPDVSGEGDLIVSATSEYGTTSKPMNVESDIDVGNITLFPKGEIYITGKISFADGSTWADHAPASYTSVWFYDPMNVELADTGSIGENGNFVIQLTSKTTSLERGAFSVYMYDADGSFFRCMIEMKRPISLSVDFDLTLFGEIFKLRDSISERDVPICGPTNTCTWAFLSTINAYIIALDTSDNVLFSLSNVEGEIIQYSRVYYLDTSTKPPQKTYVRGSDEYDPTITYYCETMPVEETVTLNLGDGKLKDGASKPVGWDLVAGTSTKYQKSFPYGTTYDTVLAGWDEAIDETTTTDKSYWGITLADAAGTKITGNEKLTGNTDFAAQYTYLNYQVCIWGIQEDDTADGKKASLTLGPATGATSACLNHGEEHTSGHCFHDDSWTDIIKNIQNDTDYYSECVDTGCTKSVPILLNSTIGDSTSITSKELCSILHQSTHHGYIKQDYVKWNSFYDDKSCESANWATSRIRATLNGKENQELSDYAGDYCLSTSNCLLSCFPPRLVKAIKAKSYKVPTQWKTTDTYAIENSLQITDKLWLPSGEEVYGDSNIPAYFQEDFHNQYSKKKNEGTKWESYNNNKAFVWNASSRLWSPELWWLRSPNRGGQYYAGSVYDDGGWSGDFVNDTGLGISLCFCL